MSEDNAVFTGSMVPPLARARDYLERRGKDLPVSALRLLAREVILRVSGAADRTVESSRDDRPLRAEIEHLCDALLLGDDQAGADLVRQARLGGMSAMTIYHVYIAGAVGLFGDRWVRDQATSARVIMGAGRVYAILRELRTVFLAEKLIAPPGAEAVFATVPGEVHGLGVTIAADTMRLKGWDIALRVGLGHDALVEEIARLKPVMVGLSASTAVDTLPTARLIVALRMRLPHVWVVLGGSLVSHDPDIVNAVDADAGALDVHDGAQKLCAHLAELNRLAGA